MPPSTAAAASGQPRHSLSTNPPTINPDQGGLTQPTIPTQSDSPRRRASPISGKRTISMARASLMKKGKQQKRSPWNPGFIWGLATLVSFALNLVTVPLLLPLYKHGIGRKEATRQETCLEAAAVAEQGGEKINGALKISAGTGMSPVSKDSVISLDHGDPTMFEPFWRRIGPRGAIVIPGWQTMSYFSDVTNICWFLEPDFAKEIRRLHRLVGNAVTEDRHIVVGTGSTQLFQAALYALSPHDAPEPMSVVSAIPYYSSYPAMTDYLRSGLFRWAGDAYAFKGNTYIELVCSPNNPDGFVRKAVLNSETGKTIHDLAYYWPQYTPITSPVDQEILLFTVSKATGHAGTRLGWAVVKDRDVAKRMINFIELNTIGVSKDSQLRAAKILKIISDGYELPDLGGMDKLFDYGRILMAKRWGRLREVVKKTGIFSLPEFPSDICNFTRERTGTYPAFAWLKCEKEGIQDCESFLRSYKIITRSGKHFGVEPAYVRVSMLDRDETFDLFIERLSSIQ